MIEIVISQRRRDLGGFEVGRVLPCMKLPDLDNGEFIPLPV